MEWLRGSGYIQYDAEQIVMLVPDKEKNDAGNLVTARDTDGSMFAKLTVLKNRTGETDKSIAIRVYGEYSYIK
jgi:replicative DNA helicase